VPVAVAVDLVEELVEGDVVQVESQPLQHLLDLDVAERVRWVLDGARARLSLPARFALL
jgi:hypothetical protein